jgi:putative restriction endonuclease
VRGFVAPTDHDWYRFLQARPHLDEVNFWRPKPDRFKSLAPGEPFFFKLRGRHNAVAGFGQFARFARLPLWMAWDVFGESNGAASRGDLQATLQARARDPEGFDLDREIGCISIAFPTFFPPDEWVPVPEDWHPAAQRGKTYDLSTGPGRALWDDCVARAVATTTESWNVDETVGPRYGTPRLVETRLGQGSFRLAVLDAYGKACAVTTEHSLPVLEAAHIKPYGQGGAHEVSNGLPLRRDLHRLFDLGFVTVRPDRSFAVSTRLRDDWANGRVYYELEGRRIAEPREPADRPDPELLEWHGDVVFRG